MIENKEQSFGIEKKHSAEIISNDGNQLEKLKLPDYNIELSKENIENSTKKARKEVSEIINNVEKNSNKFEKKQNQSASAPRRSSIGKKQRNDSYKKTIEQVQKELPIGSRAFSKITHNAVVEKASDIMGVTIARPNAMLSGAIFAFIITLLAYTIAKKSGYVLSGFETIGAFILGWIIGTIYDYLRILITGKK
mgnify:FL=1